MWLAIVLGATIGCLITVTDRIRYLISGPTATTISTIRHSTLTFPAVTICNLNNFRFGVLAERNSNLLNLIAVSEDANICVETLESVSQSENLSNITYEKLIVQARHQVEELVLGCNFAGKPCGNITKVFQPIFTSLGICYTFNSGLLTPPLQSKGTGHRQGLQLMVFVNQFEYVTPDDAGVKIAIHTQSEPPLPNDQGIGVPIGSNAFISIKEQNNQDNTGKNCRSPTDQSIFNFLQGEYTTYSESACLVDCTHTSLADDCECIGARSFYPPDTARYSQLPNCTLDNLCCITNDELISPNECNCPAACSSTSYDTTVSYSFYPAEYISNLISSTYNISANLFPTNLLQVLVYFETLNVETQTTNNAYSVIALLSDIGGQVGLFLGLSVISVLEFGDWIIKKIRGRDLSADVKKIKDKCSSYAYRQKHDTLREVELA